MLIFFFQAEDGIRDLVRSRGLGDVYKRQDPIVEPIYVSYSPTTLKVFGTILFSPFILLALTYLSLIHI